jgi:hypothetical protein
MDFKTHQCRSDHDEAGSPMPIKVSHVSALGEQTLDARAEGIKVTHKAGMSIELTSGTYTSTKGHGE